MASVIPLRLFFMDFEYCHSKNWEYIEQQLLAMFLSHPWTTTSLSSFHPAIFAQILSTRCRKQSDLSTPPLQEAHVFFISQASVRGRQYLPIQVAAPSRHWRVHIHESRQIHQHNTLAPTQVYCIPTPMFSMGLFGCLHQFLPLHVWPNSVWLR